MFVCVCNSYKDSQIRDAARSGLKCPREIYRALGAPARCGRCLEFAEAVVAEVHADGSPPINALAAAAAS